MKISIAMATFNGARYLPEQLKSFAGQTRHPDELVITDDCSTDGTMEIIKEFAKTAPFEVKYSRNEKNLGWSSNFSAALMKTSGDLVFLSDQDDVWFPEKLATIENLAKENPIFLVFMNDAALTDSELNDTGLTKLGQIRSAGFDNTKFVMGSCSAVRRELLDLCLPIPDDYREHDIWINNFAEHLSGRLIIDKVLQYYRRHENNESYSISSKTKKINQWDLVVLRLNRYVKVFVKPGKNEVSLEKLELFAKGVESALERHNGSYHDSLQTLLAELEVKIESHRLRKVIRSKPFFKRGAAIAGNLLSGNYRELSGVKSALRDLIG